MITLRPYQAQCIADLRAAYRAGHRAPLLVAPCGAGKTIMFAYMAHSHAQRRGRDAHVIIQCHRVELIDQIVRALQAFDIDPAIIAPGHSYDPDAPVVVASVWSLIRRVDSVRKPTLLVTDEAHHCSADTTWGKVAAAFAVPHLGVTATPVRMAGGGLSDVFDTLVMGPGYGALIECGALTRCRVFAPSTPDLSGVHSRAGDYVSRELDDVMDRPKVTGDCIEHYNRLTPGRRAVVFCNSVKHAHSVADAFRAAGYGAAAIDGGTERDVRTQVVSDFRSGSLQILTSCDLISEGFDVPGVEVGISLRPTKSLGLWLQQCGRVLRAAPGKTEAVILDHAGNTLRHGLPHQDRQWSLEDGAVQPESSSSAEPSARLCPLCFAASVSGSKVCPECSQPFPIKERRVARAAGDLEEITASSFPAQDFRNERARSQSLEDLIRVGQARGMKNPRGWAAHVIAAREAKRQKQWGA